MNDIKDELRPRLKEYVHLVTKPDTKAGRDMYACPVCGSGSKGDRNSDGAFHLSGETWYCHSCQNGGDIFALYAGLHNLDTKTEFPQILEGLQKELGVTVVEPVKREVTPKPKEVKEDVKQINQERMTQIETFAAALPGSPGEAYLKDRGFSNEIISKYKLGYDKEKDAVVIPYPGTDYFTKRLIHPGTRNKYDKIKGVESPTFIIKTSPSDTYVMTEGELDSLSNLQAGAHNVIASHYPNRIMDLLEETKVDGVVIVGDRDPDSKRIPEKGNKTPGESEAETMEKLFMENGIPAVVVYPPEGFKDSNDLLKVDPNQLTELIAYGTQKLQELIEENPPKEEKDPDPWASFTPRRLNEILTTETPEMVFPVKDLIPEGLTIISAAPKSGKSWMMLDLCKAIAEGTQFLKHDTTKGKCLYFDLENSDRGLKHRLTSTNRDKDIPDGILIIDSDDIRRNMTGDRLPIIGDGFEDILEKMISKIDGLRFVIIDTLSLIMAQKRRDETQYQYEYRNGSILKRIADTHHIAIAVVHHNTKMKYDNDDFANISGTYGLIGSSDLNMIIMKDEKGSALRTLAVTGRHTKETRMTMSFDAMTCSWEYIGEASGNGAANEEQKALDEYFNSDVRKAAIVICEKNIKGFKGKVSDLVTMALDYGVAIGDSLQAVGKFISTNVGKFAKYDGIYAESRSNGNAGKTYVLKRWEPTDSETENPFTQCN